MGMIVWTEKTGDTTSPSFKVQGPFHVKISGTLGGADMCTYYIGAKQTPTIIATCSWRSSKGETLETADGGQYFPVGIEIIFFKIINSSANTKLSLELSCGSIHQLS